MFILLIVENLSENRCWYLRWLLDGVGLHFSHFIYSLFENRMTVAESRMTPRWRGHCLCCMPLFGLLTFLLSVENSPQIGILVPIEPQWRNNGTSGTGSSIKHLKAVPFKTKKAPKRGNFHSPMWTYLIRTIYYILAPTKHLENVTMIVPFFQRGEVSTDW